MKYQLFFLNYFQISYFVFAYMFSNKIIFYESTKNRIKKKSVLLTMFFNVNFAKYFLYVKKNSRSFLQTKDCKNISLLYSTHLSQNYFSLYKAELVFCTSFLNKEILFEFTMKFQPFQYRATATDFFINFFSRIYLNVYVYFLVKFSC